MQDFIEREAVKEIASFQTIMRSVCCYCKRTIGYKDGLGKSDISHGACPECLEIAIAEVMKGE